MKENSAKEIQAAFKAADSTGRGMISAKELRHILTGWGEKLSSREGTNLRTTIHINQVQYIRLDSFTVDHIFREANIKPNSFVKYEDFVKVLVTPVPDY